MHSDILSSLQQAKQSDYQNDDHKTNYQQADQSQSSPVQYDQQSTQTNYEQPTQQRTFGIFNHQNRGLPFAAPAQAVLYQTVPVRTIQRKLPAARRIKVIHEIHEKKLNGKQNIVRRKITRGSTRSVEVAERAIDSIKKSLSSAIWTGITVVAVKLAPILLLGFKVRIYGHKHQIFYFIFFF